jgi:cytidyltransferase-like protein
MRVCTTGTFDIPHAGHAAFLRKAAALGDELLVGVLADEYVREYRGRPSLYSEGERLGLIWEMGYRAYLTSDQSFFFTSNRADIIAVGSDWARKDYYVQIGMSQNMLDRLGITLAYVAYTPGISSSDIKDRLAS